jgi:hypothetical protein
MEFKRPLAETAAKFGACLRLSAVLLVAAGCGQESSTSTPGLTRADLKAFDKAAPEIKQAWQVALEADRTNGLVTAQQLLKDLLAENLTPEQVQAAAKESGLVNQRLRAAAEQGDAAAKQALAGQADAGTRRGR